MTLIRWNDFLAQIEELYASPMRSPRTRKQMLAILRALEPLGVQSFFGRLCPPGALPLALSGRGG
jgi:hypothetical protein